MNLKKGLIIFNSKKNEINKKKSFIRKRYNRGSDVLQTILISGLLLVIVVTVFYPQMKNIFNSMTTEVTNWFETTGKKPFETQ